MARQVLLLVGLCLAASGSAQQLNASRYASGDETWNGRTLRLVVDDEFNSGLSTGIWEHEVSLWGGGNWEFQAYTNLPQNSFTRNGALFLKPTMTTDKYGANFLTTGRWDVKQMYGTCTMSAVYGCLREGKYGYLNPILSAKLRSRKGIRYGKVEVVAKMPRGDWLWPAIWMLPNYASRNGEGKYGGWPRSGEIDIMEARGNRHYGNLGIEYMGSTLHWGTSSGTNRYSMTSSHKKVASQTLADGYHRYTLYWDENGMDFYLDSDHVARFATPSQGFFRWGNLPGGSIWPNKNGPFDAEFYLIMNVAVGGTAGYFPDGVSNSGGQKPWSNSDTNAPEKFWKARYQWQPTWQGDDAAMQVDSVKMWQLQ